MSGLPWIFDDGGRSLVFDGSAGDCVTRSIAIAADLPYARVYDDLFNAVRGSRREMARLELNYGARARRHASPRTGVARHIYEPYLLNLGFVWTPTMEIGSGCKVHLREGELPGGALVVRCSRHITAVIDGVVHDTHDPSREGTRCVYGYYADGLTVEEREEWKAS